MHNLDLLDTVIEFMPDQVRRLIDIKMDCGGFTDTADDLTGFENCVMAFLQHPDFTEAWDVSELTPEELTVLKEWQTTTVTLHRIKQVTKVN